MISSSISRRSEKGVLVAGACLLRFNLLPECSSVDDNDSNARDMPEVIRAQYDVNVVRDKQENIFYLDSLNYLHMMQAAQKVFSL